jgi:hypothetical protein
MPQQSKPHATRIVRTAQQILVYVPASDGTLTQLAAQFHDYAYFDRVAAALAEKEKP